MLTNKNHILSSCRYKKRKTHKAMTTMSEAIKTSMVLFLSRGGAGSARGVYSQRGNRASSMGAIDCRRRRVAYLPAIYSRSSGSVSGRSDRLSVYSAGTPSCSPSRSALSGSEQVSGRPGPGPDYARPGRAASTDAPKTSHLVITAAPTSTFSSCPTQMRFKAAG